MPYDINGKPIDRKLDDDHLFGNDGCLTVIVALMVIGTIFLTVLIVIGMI